MKTLLRRTSGRNLLWPALLLLSGCVATINTGGSASREPVPQIAKSFQSVAILPVQFVSSQPDAFCHGDIGNDLRRALALRLRSKGYSATVLPDDAPQSFLLAPASPDPGTAPELINMAPQGADAALGVWVNHYMATGLCEGFGGGNVIEMGVTVALYQLPDGKELGRWQAQEWENRSGTSYETVQRLLRTLSDRLLAAVP